MNRLVGIVVSILVMAVSFFSPVPGFAIEHRYLEDFTTTTYNYAEVTRAWWDDAAGELKLFPFAPVFMGECDTPASACGIAVFGNFALVADGPAGLMVIDIHEPGWANLVGTCDTPGNAVAVSVWGEYALVADGTAGLQVINLTDPTLPVLVGTYDTPDYASSVAVAGKFVFVADGITGLLAFDISDPSLPSLEGSCNTPGPATGLDVSGQYVFVADNSTGLQVIDVSDPTNPAIVGNCPLPGTTRSVAVSGNIAYVADSDFGLRVINISDPENPWLAASLATPGNAWNLAVSGDRAFVADSGSGLQAIDISDPTDPRIACSYDTPDNAQAVVILDNLALVGDNDSGLILLAVSDRVDPTLMGNCDTPDWAFDLAVAGNHAFLADQTSGLQVIDVTDPANPLLVGSYDTPGSARRVALSGSHAVLADGTFGIQILDISVPELPWLTGTCNTPGLAGGVAVSGNHVFVADGNSGLQVIDVSDFANPVIVGSFNTLGNAYAVAVSGNHAFLADGTAGLQVIDISTPANPLLVGTCNTPDVALGLALSGGYAFVADQGSGLQIIDIANRTAPAIVGAWDTPGYADGVAVLGNRAYVADNVAGLQVIDIRSPAHPDLAAYCDTPGISYGVAIQGDYAFVADQFLGLQVIQLAQCNLDADHNNALSLPVDDSDATIIKARLTTTQTGVVTYSLSANWGEGFQSIFPDGHWVPMNHPGSDLLWASTLWYFGLGTPPIVTQLEIDWLFAEAAIDSIVDVKNDQGGWVRAHFTRSGWDFSEETIQPIASYGIWRRVEDPTLVATLGAETPGPIRKAAGSDAPDLGDLPVVRYLDRTFVRSSTGISATSFPSGTWEWVGMVPALQQDSYIAVLPTAADSSATGPHPTELVMTAHTTTPSIWYVSAPGSGWSVDNIAPGVPQGIQASYLAGGVALDWEEAEDQDFQYYRIYRGSDPGFMPSPDNLVQELAVPGWTDSTVNPWGYYYKITALDDVGNESEPGSPGMVTGVDGGDVPARTSLLDAVPNPFNPSTRLAFELGSTGHVRLTIYDAAGRLVATLVDEDRVAGRHQVVWDGRDDAGRTSAAGVYLYRLESGMTSETKRMVLIK